MALNVATVAAAAVNNFKPDASVWAGGGAAVLTVLVGAILVGAGVVIPPVSVLGVTVLASATPLTMAMVTAAAIPIGHVVSSFVPATYNQQLDQFAKKIGTSVENLKNFVPVIQQSYPGTDGQGPTNISNITPKP